MKKMCLIVFGLLMTGCMTTTASHSARITGNEKVGDGYRFFGVFGDDIYAIAKKHNIRDIKVVEKDSWIGVIHRTTIYGD